jgi:hypothetical protein
MSLSHSPSIVRNGLVLYLDAANKKSYPGTGNTWIDLSGNGNNGTLTNGPAYSATNGGSIVFDGTNDLVSLTLTLTLGQPLTVMGWLNSTESSTIYRNFFENSNATTPMIWWQSQGKIEFDTGANYTTTAVYRNEWVHVSLSKPSGTSVPSYYVNGTLVGTGTTLYSVPASTLVLFNRAAAQTWKGSSSNIQVYNRALTAIEVNQNFNALRGRYGI